MKSATAHKIIFDTVYFYVSPPHLDWVGLKHDHIINTIHGRFDFGEDNVKILISEVLVK
jgi:hypothetical protein